MIVIWYYTNYVMRKNLSVAVTDLKIPQLYKSLDSRVAKRYLILSIVLFFVNFLLFFAITVWTLQDGLVTDSAASQIKRVKLISNFAVVFDFCWRAINCSLSRLICHLPMYDPPRLHTPPQFAVAT